MRNEFLATCLFLSLSLSGCNQKPSSEFKIPPEEAGRENPVKPTDASIAEGNQDYQKFDCAVCHAKNGNGKGFMAGASHYACRDWRDPASLKNFTDGELFYVINKGKGYMPAYEHKINPRNAWMMVGYIRSFAKQSP
jgi:mono/diheme cytochrome c family protein